MTKKIEAAKFANTVRGQYIIGQALFLAIQSIEARPKIEQEPSNVADMRFLMENLFPTYSDIQKAFQANAPGAALKMFEAISGKKEAE